MFWRLKKMLNYLDVRNIHCKIQRVVGFAGAFALLYFVMLYRVVLGLILNAVNGSNSLIISMLNNISVFACAEKYAYLCEAKVPYYGWSTYRHRAHDNASPLQDAAGSRGIDCKGWTIV